MGAGRRLLLSLSPERRRCAAVIGLMAASALGEMAVPYYMGRASDWVAREDELAAILPMVLLGLSSAVTELVCDVTFVGTLSRTQSRLQRRVFAAVLRQDIAELCADGAGDVATRVTRDAEDVREALGEALSLLLWYLARGVCLFATMAWLSPRMALLTMLALPLLLALPRAVGHFRQALAPQMQKAQAQASEVAVETFQAMATVRSFANEDGAAAHYRQRLQQSHRLEKKDVALYTVSVWTSGFSALALKVGILYYGGQLVAAGTVSTGDLVTFLLYQMQFTDVVEVLLRYYPTLTKAVGSSEKIFEFLDREPQVAPSGTVAPSDLQGHLQLEDVWFSYPGRQEPVLKGVSLELRPGEVLALLGPPGAGKSTLVALVSRLHQPTAGRLLLDGHPLPSYQHSYLCRQVAVVPQEPLLFARSLHANISYGLGCCSRAQVTAAARKVGAHNFITHLPQGYDTEVGELGGQLSGGQRQAVAIARALLRDPRILILDEHSSALDTECQQQVEQEILAARGSGRAVLMVTGRAALAARAQRVAVLDGGEVRQQGPPHEVLHPGSPTWHLLQDWGQQGAPRKGDRGSGDEG
ncbi:antigen peptide transporter 1 isoform X2 [Tympanuchus pallidicinctus]|uniref:antigen peptide transporter 1 isoform X2 n=1 Tax=Tympanuchus pallidicinctus TaxID=109042 RepID=UPI0022870FD8|nr:antigen peptide transporter 1 isoform X2 [Tympanuchus pallidicinctus]